MTSDLDELKKYLGLNIKHFRKIKKLTQIELSIQANVSERYIKMLEKGMSSPSMAVLCTISAALNIEPYVLLKNPDECEK